MHNRGSTRRCGSTGVKGGGALLAGSGGGVGVPSPEDASVPLSRMVNLVSAVCKVCSQYVRRDVVARIVMVCSSNKPAVLSTCSITAACLIFNFWY